MDVAKWLGQLGLSHYAEAFEANDVTEDILGSLDDDDLKSIGITSLGHRKRLLAAIAALDAPASAAEPPSEGERRPVTIMFADLTGFTQLADAMDAEDLHDLLGRFFQAVDGVVQSHGGTIDKHIGDCTMALFGAPIAHGDDPQRAVHAAVDTREAVARLAQETGRDVGVHIGIAGGDVVASQTGSDVHRSYTVTGNSVNVASRLTDLAADGEILIARSVYRDIAGLVLVEPIGEVTLKGIERPVDVLRLRGLASGAVVRGGAFVGRRAELQQFTAALASCGDLGNGGALVVRGEPGIGKTRLVEEFREKARAGNAACHTALVLDFGAGAGTDPVRMIARSLVGVGHDADETARAAAADAAQRAGLVDDSDEAFLRDLLDLPQPMHFKAVIDVLSDQARRHRRTEALVSLARNLSRRSVLVLVVEDAHWADRETLDALAMLAAATADSPILLVLTTRPEGDPLDATWRSRLGGAAITTIDLTRLRDQEARELATTVGGSPELIERCLTRAEGNPLFLEQLLRNADEGASVPGSVQSVVLARIDRLASQQRRAMQAAAALGQRFDGAAVRFMIADPGFDFDELMKRYLIRPEGGDTFLFAHALIRDGIYAAMLRERARELHEKAASWFENRDAVLYAEHLSLGGNPEAPAAFLVAAEQQRSVYRNDVALSLARRGKELAKRSADLFALTASEGEILLDQGEADQALAAFRAAESEAGEPADVARVLLDQASVLRLTDRLDEALRLLDRAEPEAREAGRIDLLARIHHMRGNVFFPQGRAQECLAEQRAALDAARSVGAPELIAMALGGLGDAEYASTMLLSANRHFEECVAIAREHGLGRIEVANGSMIAVTRLADGPMSRAVEEAEANLKAAQRVGHGRAQIIGHHAAAQASIFGGDTKTAMYHTSKARQLTERVGAKRFEPENDIFEALIFLQLGRTSEAAAIAETVWSNCDELAIPYLGGLALGCLAQATPDPVRRQWALAEGERLLTMNTLSHNHLYFRICAIEACLGAGAWDEAEHHAGALDREFAKEPTPMVTFMVSRARMLARKGRGETIDTAETARLIDDGRALGCLIGVKALETVASG